MLMILSPAKTLDFESSLSTRRRSIPACSQQAAEVIESLLKLSRKEIAGRMKLKPELAETTCRQFTDWQQKPTTRIARPAALAYRGNAFVGLDAATFSEDDFAFAQDSLRILSGLYGILRPLDLIQPYRLEMGARFRPPHGGDLYGFWDGRLTAAVNDVIAKQPDPSVINLASKEYFKAVRVSDLKGPVITPVFKEVKSGVAKVLGMFAKRARGAMARYIIKNRLESPHQLKSFVEDSYAYRPELSDEKSWVFTREQPPPAA